MGLVASLLLWKASRGQMRGGTGHRLVARRKCPVNRIKARGNRVPLTRVFTRLYYGARVLGSVRGGQWRPGEVRGGGGGQGQYRHSGPIADSLSPYRVHFLTKVTKSSAIIKTPIIASAAPMPLAQPVGCGAHLP